MPVRPPPTLDEAATAVEGAFRAFTDTTRYIPDDGSPNALAQAFSDLKAALEHMRFQRPYVQDGVFKKVDFGKTPQMPTVPMWPQHALQLAWMRTERMNAIDYNYVRFVELVDALEALQRRLVFEADCQESIDAHNTCRQYLQAAGYIDRVIASLVTMI